MREIGRGGWMTSGVIAATLACGGSATAGLAAQQEAPPPGALTRHVLLVSVDGLRPDAITATSAPTVERLAREGSRSFQATTVSPSTTLPAHVSMLTGSPPEVHGVTWNVDLVDLDGYAAFPTVLSGVEGAGLAAAAFLGKSKLRFVSPPGSLDHVSLPASAANAERASETVDKVLAYLEKERPNLLFVHLGDPDYAGHQHGWMSIEYDRTVRAVDAQLARLLSAADRAFGAGGYTVIITADHGGHSHNHGSDDDRDVAIPWILWGRGIAAGTEPAEPVNTIDTAPTVLRLMGLPPLPDMRGRAVESVLAPGAEAAAVPGGGQR